MRDGGDAGLLALDDSVRRGPLYSRKTRGHGTVAPDPHAVPRRYAEPCAVPRHGRRGAGEPALAREGGPALYEYARRPAAGAANPGAAKQGHEADCDDHGR